MRGRAAAVLRSGRGEQSSGMRQAVLESSCHWHTDRRSETSYVDVMTETEAHAAGLVHDQDRERRNPLPAKLDRAANETADFR